MQGDLQPSGKAKPQKQIIQCNVMNAKVFQSTFFENFNGGQLTSKM